MTCSDTASASHRPVPSESRRQNRLGRGYQKWIGTNDYGLSGDSGSGPSNMVKTEAIEFDDRAAGGNSYITERSTNKPQDLE